MYHKIISVDSAGLGIGTHVFYIEVTDTNGCVTVDTISITIDICSVIDLNENESLIQVYPNPSTGIYTISANKEFAELAKTFKGDKTLARMLKSENPEKLVKFIKSPESLNRVLSTIP